MMYGIAEDNSNSNNYTNANATFDANCLVGTYYYFYYVYIRTTKYSVTKDSVLGAICASKLRYGGTYYSCYGLRPSLIYKE